MILKLSNPITVKELRARMRGIRAILPMMAYLVVLGIFILIQFSDFGRQMAYEDLANRGSQLGFYLLFAQIVLVLLLSPAYAASAITVEKERETFETMQATLMTAWDIVSGKVTSGVAYAILLVLASLPLLSLSIWMGGFDFRDLFWGFLVIGSTALVVSSLGIFLSTLFARSYLATGVTYGALLAGIGGSYLFRGFLNWWYMTYPGSASNIMTEITFFVTYTLNPLEMLTVLNSGGTSYYYTASSMSLKNPIIDNLERLLGLVHVPYVVVHVALAFLLAWAFLFWASYFLFRSSREGPK